MAKEEKSSKEITNPSNLFGYELLPECTFESEYGKLIVTQVIVPDFSSDEKNYILLKEEFDNLKSFITEKDLSKKLSIVEKIYDNIFLPLTPEGKFKFSFSDMNSRKNSLFAKFIDFFRANMRARLFEMGVYSNVALCVDFGYEERASLPGKIFYNDSPIFQPLSCAGGLYLYCLRCALNNKNFCVYMDLLEEILKQGLPNHNYLSWAFFRASNDLDVISFTSRVHLSLCFLENEN